MRLLTENMSTFLSIVSAFAALGAGICIGRYGCPSVPDCKCPEHNLDEHEKLIAPVEQKNVRSGGIIRTPTAALSTKTARKTKK